jgi:hypothetical protein
MFSRCLKDEKSLEKSLCENKTFIKISMEESEKYKAVFLCNVSKKIAVEINLGQTEPGTIPISGEKHKIYPGGCLSIPVDFEGGVAKMIVNSNKHKIWNGIIPIGCPTEINISPEKQEIRYREQTLPQTLLLEEKFTFISSGLHSYGWYILGIIILAFMIYKFKKT